MFALDALTGGQLWQYSRPPSAGLVGDARLGTNRGVALLARQDLLRHGQRPPARARSRQRQAAVGNADGARHDGSALRRHRSPRSSSTTRSSPALPARIKGFADSSRRSHPTPARSCGGPGPCLVAASPAATRGKAGNLSPGGGSTWLTGSYDAASDTLYWATGNPWPDSNDVDRPGDNLYTNCVLALNARTGELKWHYQFTPHDLKDRDATEPNVLVDTVYQGKPAKLLLHADRNGFFYVLDRTNGKVLLAKPFLRRVDWASSIGPDGRPVVKDPRGCPSDAANWSSTAYSPQTRLYYFLALEECVGDKPGGYPDQTGQRFLRAVNIETGDIVWEVPQPGAARAKTWSGVLATAGGLVFYGQPNGGFTAVDQRDGKTLWQFPTNVRMKASPMTFAVAGQQYVAVAAGPNILCFGL